MDPALQRELDQAANIAFKKHYVIDGRWNGKEGKIQHEIASFDDFVTEIVGLGLCIRFRRDGKLIVGRAWEKLDDAYNSRIAANFHAHFKSLRALYDACMQDHENLEAPEGIDPRTASDLSTLCL